MPKRKVVWTKISLRQFNAAIEYIRQDSEQNGDKVKEKMLNKINELSDTKVVHRQDPYKKNNDGNYLYFELQKYRIVYYVMPGKVVIIRIRHTSMELNNINDCCYLHSHTIIIIFNIIIKKKNRTIDSQHYAEFLPALIIPKEQRITIFS